MVTAVNGWLLAYDNIGVIRPWLSDGLCRLATGGGFAGRALFSNDERVVLHAQRPVILNGIEEFVQRGDLSDRTVFLNLPPIAPGQRCREDEFWPAFYLDRPRILGGLLDAVAGGLRELPSVKLAELPRMADFAAFAEAVGRAVGWNAGYGPRGLQQQSQGRERHTDRRVDCCNDHAQVRADCAQLVRHRDGAAQGARRPGGKERNFLGRVAQITDFDDE